MACHRYFFIKILLHNEYKHAFKELVKDGDINTEGTGAYYLYNLYSHTGYSDAKDSDFDGERSFYQFCVDNNLI